MYLKKVLVFPALLFFSILAVQGKETLPILTKEQIPQTHFEMWEGFDPRSESLETEILREWEQDEVVLRIVRYRIGFFKGTKAMMAGVYGFPKGGTAEKTPGLLQIHGGGQYADYKAVLANAKRGYATLSIAWAGRISAPNYRVSPNEVKLFWDGKIKDPNYRITTDWGALDAYHAPSRYGKDAFRSIPVENWTMDPVESPRNNSWFLITLAARRGLTFLERQPQVDPTKLGVYGHSMGGKLTVLTAGSDERVIAAAPSCGGISDRYSSNPLHLATVSDSPSLKKISCPIVFLSPSNDFHGRINDLKTAITEIPAKDWRITCSPHHNHQDTPEHEVLTQLWFDQYLKKSFKFPQTPSLNMILGRGEIPFVTLGLDETWMREVDVYYTQQGQIDGKKDNSNNTKNRFWHHSKVFKSKGKWSAELPIFSLESPLWVYANVTYELPKPISGAGYYYGEYTADHFVLSSLMQTANPSDLKASQIKASMKRQEVIEDFRGSWEKEWFNYRPSEWGLSTHKVYDPVWKAPANAKLGFEVYSDQPNKLVVRLDSYAVKVPLKNGGQVNKIQLKFSDFRNVEGKPLNGWDGIKELRFSKTETLRPDRGSETKPKKLSSQWEGEDPKIQNLRWVSH